MVFLILQKSMGGVASRLQGGEGARRLEESGEELGNPLGRGTKRRREVEDDIKVIH